MGIDFSITESKTIKGVWIIKPSISEDSRGNIWTSFLKDKIEKFLPNELYFKHDKFSLSRKNVLRGLHGDKKTWKLVSCPYGKFLLIVVNYIRSSRNYLKSVSDASNEIFRIYTVFLLT